MKYSELAQKLVERDKNAMEDFHCGSNRGIEANLSFVSYRAENVGAVLLELLNKLAEQEDAKEGK